MTNSNHPPIETSLSLLKEIRDTTPIVMQRKRIDAFFAAMGDASTRKDEGAQALESSPVASREIPVIDKALANAAEILANFKAAEAHEDGTVKRKLKEWQACYAKLFTQMNEMVQSSKPVMRESCRISGANISHKERI